MAKYLFGETAAPEAADNNKFKRRTKASVPKMNFHVWAVPRVEGPPPTAAPIGSWRYLGGFTDVTGLTANTEVIEINDSDTNGLTIKAAGKTSYGDITLNRGFDHDGFMQGWHQQQQGMRHKSDRYMLDLVIFKLTQDPTKIFRCFLLTNAWITNYTAGDMDTTTIDPWVEGATLAVDGWSYGFPTDRAHDDDGVTDVDAISESPIEPLTGGPRKYTLSDDFLGGYELIDGIYTPVVPSTFFRYGEDENAL